MAVERVACIEKKRVLGRGLWRPSGELEAWNDHVAFIPRHKQDPQGIESPYFLGATWLQLAAYVVPRHDGLVFVFNRAKGSDPRLEGRLAIALGGHVNLEDWADTRPSRESLPYAVLNAASREIVEEAPALAGCDRSLSALLYAPETRNPIDRVHLGVVFSARVSWAAAVSVEDETMGEVGWFYPGEALARFRGRFEGWSEVILNHLAGCGDPLL